MANDTVSKSILENVVSGNLTPEQGLELLGMEASNGTLKPDPLSREFWALVGYCAAGTVGDLAPGTVGGIAKIAAKVLEVGLRVWEIVP